MFICPIYTDNLNKLEEEYELQKQLLANHFGATTLTEVSETTSTDVMFKCAKWNDNSKGLVCTCIMYGTYYSYVVTIKIDYNQLNN